MANTTEFWLISAPGESTTQQTFDSLNALTSGQRLSVNHKFHIPSDLKVGTLDQLVGLSDELNKLDLYAEGVTKKMASSLNELNADDNTSEPLQAAGVPLDQYVVKFKWDAAKYPTKQSLKTISEIIAKTLTQIDTDLKTKSSAYNNSKTTLLSLEKKATGSLLTRNLGDLVKREYFVLGSEYLTTVLVVVPKNLFRDWYAKYENLTDMVVPRSTQLISEDADHGLFTVTLFQKAVDTFKNVCKTHKFTVRDFKYDEEQLAGAKNEIVKLQTDMKKQYALLLRWLKVNFSEAFAAWIHVKALRLFVESVLRYGLPVNFQPMLLLPNKKSMRKLRELLNQHYAHLDTSLAQGPMDDIPGLNLQNEYYPYVYFKITLDFGK